MRPSIDILTADIKTNIARGIMVKYQIPAAIMQHSSVVAEGHCYINLFREFLEGILEFGNQVTEEQQIEQEAERGQADYRFQPKV